MGPRLDLAAAFINRLRIMLAISAKTFRSEPKPTLPDGVAVNKAEINSSELLCGKPRSVYARRRLICDLYTDNAAMIIRAGSEHLANGDNSSLDLAPRSRYSLVSATSQRSCWRECNTTEPLQP